ncbi:penicillin-binding protein [Micromonospora sicca]|uniref:Penicillin-binding protein n=2 Tax=Micromonospora TaxID=1873 RepID=A0A317CUJ9_9ACTN|nr:PASTA domain-containing protein [Micromonospora sp. 4G51]PWR06268.1 penicillin-binding protein [Micromonospora sp. 4G51]
MTDGYPERQTAPGPADQGPDRVRLLLGGGLAVALLAVIGASGGWLIAGGDPGPAGPPAAAVTTAPAQTPTTDGPHSTPPVTRTTARTTPAGGLTVPELVGVDFTDARRQLHERKLGWRLVFGTGTGRNVERTSPEPGTPVRRGVTVTLWVAGPAPAVAVPDLVGDDCAAAADDLVEAGLYPRYRTGRRGTVTAQDPAAGASARWNDPVALGCGDPPSTTPDSPAPTP